MLSYRSLAVSVLMAICAVELAQAGPPVPPGADPRPWLIDFWAADCPWCIRQDAVLASPDVADLLRQVKYVKEDMGRPLGESGRRLWAHLGRNAVPLLVLLSPQGTVIAVGEGFHDPARLRALLTPHLAPPPQGFPPMPPVPDVPPPGSGLSWPPGVIGTWRLDDGTCASFLPGGRFELSNAPSGSLAGMRDGAFIVNNPQGFYKIEVQQISQTNMQVTFIHEATNTRRRHSADRLGDWPERDTAPSAVQSPALAEAPTGHFEYLRAIRDSEDYGWDEPASVSFRGTNYANSYRTGGRQRTGKWDLAQFQAKGFGAPTAFTGTFGLETSAELDTTYQIEIWGNSQQLTQFLVTLDAPQNVNISLKGIYRLEIRATRLGGDGRTVMIEPKVYF